MSTNRPAQSPLPNASDKDEASPQALVFMDKRKLQKQEPHCLQPIPGYDRRMIRELRDRYRISQAVLAVILNTSLSTVRQWEIGDKHPSGPSLKLLSILDRKGLDALI